VTTKTDRWLDRHWLLRDRLWEAAREGRVDDVSQLSTHFTGDVDTLGGALYWACEYGQLNVVTWLVEHTVLRDDGDGWERHWWRLVDTVIGIL
jgi:hypothetical protein